MNGARILRLPSRQQARVGNVANAIAPIGPVLPMAPPGMPMPFGAPLGPDPCDVPPPGPCIVRPLDWRKPIQRGSAFRLCKPGDEQTIVLAENLSVQCAESIDVTLTSEAQGEVTFDPASFAWPHLVAHICWGIGSQTFDAWVDVMTATHFSIVAELIRVSVAYEIQIPPWMNQCPPCLPEYLVGGGLGYGCNKRTQLTQVAMLQNPGDTVILCIPPFAEFVNLLPVNGADVSARIVGFGGQLGVDVPSTGGERELARIYNGAQFVEVKNNQVTGSAFAFLVFELSL